jgi:hypothetical protein
LESKPIEFEVFQEKLRVVFSAGVSASIVAEAQGSLSLDVTKGADKVGITVAQGPAKIGKAGTLKGSAFAGGKAGIEISAKIDWVKRSAYGPRVEKWIRKTLKEHVPHAIVDRIPDKWIGSIAKAGAVTLIGEGGVSTLLNAKIGLTGSAGIGGEAAFSAGFSGGRIRYAANLSGTIGLGVGYNYQIDLDAVDGVRFLGLALIEAAQWVFKKFGTEPAKIQAAFDKKCTEAKRDIGKTIHEYGTGKHGRLADYAIPDSVAKKAAEKLGYKVG